VGYYDRRIGQTILMRSSSDLVLATARRSYEASKKGDDKDIRSRSG